MCHNEQIPLELILHKQLQTDRFYKLEAHLPEPVGRLVPTLAVHGKVFSLYRAELTPALESGRARHAIWRFRQSLLDMACVYGYGVSF